MEFSVFNKKYELSPKKSQEFETVSSIKLHYYLDSYENYSLFF